MSHTGEREARMNDQEKAVPSGKKEEIKDDEDSDEEVKKNRSATVANLPLAWTTLGNQEKAPKLRYPSDVADLDPTEDELYIVGTAGQKITHMGPDLSTRMDVTNPDINKLILRSHVIRTMEGLQHFRKLHTLELYDNQVEALECLDEGEDGAPGCTLKVLDMSYNVIRDMAPVQVCPHLTELCKCYR